MPACPAMFWRPENEFVESVTARVTLIVKLWTERPRDTLSDIGAAMLVFVVLPPRFGNTFGCSLSFRRYWICTLSMMFVPRPAPPRPPGAPRPPPAPPKRPPPATPRPPCTTVGDRFCVTRRLMLSDEVCEVVETW